MKKSRAVSLLSLTLALLLALGCAGPAHAEGTKKNTIMIYMCGADLESSNGQATSAISDILASRFNRDEINVVLLLGGCKRWSQGYPSDKLTILEIGGRRPVTVDTLPLTSMGDPDTLSSFLTFCHDNYPAERFDLVMWDHGGGPNLGVCVDVQFDSDWLSLHELVAALRNSPFADKGLGMIAFNACLMGSAEVSAMVAPFAHYMVATEDSMFGLTYDWLAGLEEDPTAMETAVRVVDSSFAMNAATIERQHASLINSFAAIDLSKTDALVGAVDSFFANMEAGLSETTFTAMSTLRRDATTFGVGESGGNSDYDLVDLGDLVKRNHDVAPAEAEALEAAIQEAVVYRRSAQESCSGMTVYHPYQNKMKFSERIGVYNTLDFSGNYTAYIQNFAAILTDTPLAQWTELYTGVPDANKDNRTLFTLKLNEEQAAQYGDSALDVLLMNEDGSYSFTFANNKTAYDDGALTGEFSGTALYAVAEDGTRLSPELEYQLTPGGIYRIPAVLHAAGKDGRDDMTHTALIACELDPATKQLSPGGVQVWDEASGGYTSVFGTSFADYDDILVDMTARSETRNERGELLPFAEWEVVSTSQWSAPIDGSWGFALVNDTLDTEQLYATFQVTDSQNNVYSSEPRVVKTKRADAGEVYVAYDDADLVLIESMTCSPVAEGVMLTGSLTSLAEQEIIVTLENLVVNGVETGLSAEVFGTGDNWGLLNGETQPLFVNIGADLLAGFEAVTDVAFDLTVSDAESEEVVGVIPVEMTLNLAL